MTLYKQTHVWPIFRIRSLTHLEVTFINFFSHLYFQAVGSSSMLSAALDGAKRTLELMNVETK